MNLVVVIPAVVIQRMTVVSVVLATILFLFRSIMRIKTIPNGVSV